MSFKRKFDLNMAALQDTEMNNSQWIHDSSLFTKKSSPTSGSFQEAKLRQEKQALSVESRSNSDNINNQDIDSMLVEDAIVDNYSIQCRYVPINSYHQYTIDSNPFVGITNDQTYASPTINDNNIATLWRTGNSSDMTQESVHSLPNFQNSNKDNLTSANNHDNNNSSSYSFSSNQHQRQTTLTAIYGGRMWHH